VNFDTAEAGKAPTGWTATQTGKKAIEWDDDTFTKPGAVGVWTKADSVTLFDDFSYDGK
jgi:hypothetical protein